MSDITLAQVPCKFKMGTPDVKANKEMHCAEAGAHVHAFDRRSSYVHLGEQMHVQAKIFFWCPFTCIPGPSDIFKGLKDIDS